MAFCNIHGYYKDGTECNTCLWIESDRKKKEEKALRQISKKHNKTIEAIAKQKEKKIAANNLVKELLKANPNAKIIKSNVKSRPQLKKELQDLWSKKMKAFYKEKNLYICFIDNVKDNRKGLLGLHVSHYFAKSDLWPLWCDPVNSGLSTNDRNFNKPETVGLMRMKLVEIWGKEAFEDLEKRATEIKNKINMGLEKKYPPTDWLLASIQELKNELKNK